MRRPQTWNQNGGGGDIQAPGDHKIDRNYI